MALSNGHPDFYNIFLSTITDRVTTTVAVAGAASPVWLPSMQEYSTFASLLLPIVGCIWLLLQITLKVGESARLLRAQNAARAKLDDPSDVIPFRNREQNNAVGKGEERETG